VVIENAEAVPTILVSRPGIMRQSLNVALTMCAWISVVAVAGDGLNALNQVMDHQPQLLIIDSNLLDEEVETLLAAVKTSLPAVRCLLLVQSNYREAELLAAHADAVVLRSAPASHLVTVLRRLVQAPVATEWKGADPVPGPAPGP
jgi:DNA-binding NarL/FixJ family response regulator